MPPNLVMSLPSSTKSISCCGISLLPKKSLGKNSRTSALILVLWTGTFNKFTIFLIHCMQSEEQHSGRFVGCRHGRQGDARFVGFLFKTPPGVETCISDGQVFFLQSLAKGSRACDECWKKTKQTRNILHLDDDDKCTWGLRWSCHKANVFKSNCLMELGSQAWLQEQEWNSQVKIHIDRWKREISRWTAVRKGAECAELPQHVQLPNP